MELIKCKGCESEISPEAATCPKCGHPQRKPSHAGGCAIVVLLAIAALYWLGSNGSSSVTQADVCPQSGEAAHYIAAKSTSSDDVVRVTDEVIAERKYPALGDKMLAAIGSVVALSRGTYTPDEVSAKVQTACEAHH